MATRNRNTGKDDGGTPNDPAADQDYYDPDAEPVSLGEVAAAGLHAVTEEQGGVQEVAPGMEYATHLRFLGMGYRTNDEAEKFRLGDEHVFLVRAQVVEAEGKKLMADGHVRHPVALKVMSVTVPGDGGE